MENSLKQRIVGAIVLIGLAVIFLPAILKDKSQTEPFESQIPAKPIELVEHKISDDDLQNIDKTRNKLDEMDKETEQKSRSLTEAVVRKSKTKNGSAGESAAGKKQAESEIQVVSAIESNNDAGNSASKEGNESKEASEKESEKADKTVIAKQFIEAAWLIKVASFSSRENAVKMVEKLLAAKHKAYRRSVKIENGTTIYRIYVGPYIEKSSAEKALKQVNAVSETKGMLIPYDPGKH